ncbi:unnamed protein product [Clonostachys solani]|uniref:Uncharacterized protein n=1 Tax=Clonostachys solani TaxID=160281 RepID=A0A9N9Z7W3_9HYPO|nr:unnamed protein product [Clonostachys solani]
MALPPPNEYRTLYDLPLLDEPKLSNNPSQASRQFTEYYEDLDDVGNELLYGPREFLAILTRYYSLCRHQQEVLNKTLEKRPALELHLHRSRAVIKFEGLKSKITAQLDRVMSKILSIAKELRNHYEDIPEGVPDLSQSESAPHVANISVRECRLWCQLNTTKFRQRLQNANDTAELRSAMDAISDMILGDVAKVPTPYVFNLTKKDRGIVTPLVYFVCTGMDKEGNQLHDLVHVGCTKEQFRIWEPFQEHRNKARDDLIGQEAIEAWKNWHGQLLRLGADDSNDTRKLRENLMQGNIGELPDWAHWLSTTKLRACENHVGQSFTQVGWNHTALMGCCMICKTAISFQEVMGKDFQEEARLIHPMKRRHCPHSCAEVVTSGACDFTTWTH